MESIKALLQLLPHKLQVRFALNCAIDCKQYLDKTDTSSLKCIELVEKWLKDPSSVSNAELTAYASARAYTSASASASYASYAASDYASASASYAASASAYASASYASYASGYASAPASSAAYSASKEEKLKQYENDLKEIIKGLTNLQKALCGIN